MLLEWLLVERDVRQFNPISQASPKYSVVLHVCMVQEATKSILSLDLAKPQDAPNSHNYLHLHMLRHLVAAASWLNNEAHV